MALTIEHAKRIIEATLFYSNEPMSVKKLAEVFSEQDDVNINAVQDILGLIKDDYQNRGVELIEVATGFRFQVCANLSDWITRLMTEKPARYSRALLETLALIAYKQPITRAEIEDVRGVSVSSNIIRTLEEREWIKVIGHRDVPGKPALFATTKHFLNDMNLTSLSQLPTLAEIQDLDDGQLTQQLQLSLGDEQKTDQIINADQEAQSSENSDTPGEDVNVQSDEEIVQDTEPDNDHNDDDINDRSDDEIDERHSDEDDIEQNLIEPADEEPDSVDIEEEDDQDDEDLDDSLDMILEEIYEDG